VTEGLTPTTPVEPAAPAEPAKAEEFVPLTADAVKLPEGFNVDAPTMEKFLGLMNDQKMSAADRVNGLANLQAEVLKSQSEKAMADWEGLNASWQEEVKADPVLGGQKLDMTLAGINTLINTHGTPELRQVMDATGAGNNIHVVRFLSKVAGLLGEGKPATGVPSAAPRPIEQTMYPTMFKGT
jgi:hypothetical protein